MSTYNISRNLCEILNTEFDPKYFSSDQELNEIPEDALTNPHIIYFNLGTIAAAEVNRGKKRPKHSEIMRKYYQEGRIKPPRKKSGIYKLGEESKRNIGEKSGAKRLGQKRGPYKILNRKIETCKCGRTISGAYNIKRHYDNCKQS